MENCKTRPGVELLEIHGAYLLVADKAARKARCRYVRQINETGAFIWRLLAAGGSPEEAAAAIRREYDADDVDITAEVEAFIALLAKRRYLVPDTEGAAS